MGIPQESVRDQIACAAHKLYEGNWEGCFQEIDKAKFWKVHPETRTQTIGDLKEKIKISAMMSYIYGSLPCYDSFSLSSISKMFQLKPEEISKILSRVRFIWQSFFMIGSFAGTLEGCH